LESSFEANGEGVTGGWRKLRSGLCNWLCVCKSVIGVFTEYLMAHNNIIRSWALYVACVRKERFVQRFSVRTKLVNTFWGRKGNKFLKPSV
jgi:hypothetical protein